MGSDDAAYTQGNNNIGNGIIFHSGLNWCTFDFTAEVDITIILSFKCCLK